MPEQSLSHDFLAGRFQPGDSILHRMRPGRKVFGIGILVILTAVGNVPVWGGLLLLAGMGLVMADISPAKIWKLLKTFKWFLLVIGGLPVIMTPGHAIQSLAFFPVDTTWEGLSAGAESILKFTLMIFFSMILMRTTAPGDLMPAATKMTLFGYPILNRWLKEFFAVGIGAFQLIPLLIGEVEQFILSRCGALEGSRWDRFKSALDAGLFLGPLLVHLLSQANRWEQEVMSQVPPLRREQI